MNHTKESTPAALSTKSGEPGVSAAGRGLGVSLLVVATAQLMLVLDDTFANLALPSIQRELAVSAAALPWIISAYVLTFGSLLLLGGRAGDLSAVDVCCGSAWWCSRSPRSWEVSDRTSRC